MYTHVFSLPLSQFGERGEEKAAAAAHTTVFQFEGNDAKKMMRGARERKIYTVHSLFS